MATYNKSVQSVVDNICQSANNFRYITEIVYVSPHVSLQISANCQDNNFFCSAIIKQKSSVIHCIECGYFAHLQQNIP